MADHAVIVHLVLSDSDFGTEDERARVHELSDRIEAEINLSGVGEFDGDEFGAGECTLYMYGPDADALFDAIEPVLRGSTLSSRGYAIKRYGDAEDPDAREVRVDL